MNQTLKKFIAIFIATMMIVCSSGMSVMAEETPAANQGSTIQVDFDINTSSISSNDGLETFGIQPILTTGSVSLVIPRGTTVYDVFKKVADERGIEYSANEDYKYVQGISWAGDNLLIADDASNPFGVSVKSSISSYPGWMYLVNGNEPNVGAGDYVLSDGDSIEYRYGIINVWDASTSAMKHYDWEFLAHLEALKEKMEDASGKLGSSDYNDEEKLQLENSIENASNLMTTEDAYMGAWILYFNENPLIWGGENSQIELMKSALVQLDHAINKLLPVESVESVEFPDSQKNIQIAAGEKIQLKAFCIPENASQDLKYEVMSGGEYVTVTSSGMLEGLLAYDGLILIKATSPNGKSSTAKVKVSAADVQEKVAYKTALNNSLKYIKETRKSPKLNDEWAVLSILRDLETDTSNYADEYIENISKEELSQISKSIDISRIIIAVTSAGKNVENVGGYNALKKLSDFNDVKLTGINGSIYSLIAINCGQYNIPQVSEGGYQNTVELMISEILENEIPGGGWALSGSKADPDITAMALQALAPYYLQDAKIEGKSVRTYVERALDKLGNLQLADGGYKSAGTINSCSSAQVLTALCELKIEPAKDGRFIKNENTLLDAVLSYYTDGGGFKYTQEYGINAMATDQCSYSLVSYDRLINAKNGLYDMSDVEFNVQRAELLTQIKVAEAKDKNEYNALTWSQMQKVLLEAKTLYGNLTSKQGEIDREVQKLKEALAELKEKPIEKVSIEDGRVNIPKDNDKNFEIEVNADKKVEITIPQNTQSRITLKADTKKEISEIRASKGSNRFEIPQGIIIKEGSGEIEIFGAKTDLQKNNMQDEIKNLLKKTDDKLKAVKVEEAFKFGDSEKTEFDGYVEIVFAGMAGKGAAYSDNSGIHIIDKVLNDGQGEGKSEYAVDKGTDLVVKTKHFTDFIAYSFEKDSSGNGGNGGEIKDKTVTLSIDKKTINKGYVLSPVQVKISKGESVWDVLKREMDSRGISYDYSGSGNSIYVKSIADDGEFDNGPNSGWMYSVGGTFSKNGCGQYYLNGGENIQWRYTTNLGEDLGQDNSSWGGSGGAVSVVTAEAGTSVLKPETTVTNGEAKAEIEAKFIKGMVSEAISKNLNQMVIEPKVDSKIKVNKIMLVLEKESIEKIAKETKASLKLKTQIADIKLSNKSLAGLAKEKGNTVTFAVKTNNDGSISFEIKSGLDTVNKISSGISVSIPVEKPSSSTVAVQMMPDGSEKILMKSITEGNYLNARMDGSATVKIIENKKIYADTANHWAKDAIEFASAREILKGTSADKFSPNATMTKGMLVTLLHRFENEELVQGKAYDDVKSDAYYANAAAWAQVKGIAEGETDTQFLPNQEVTREQLATMIYNYAKLSGEDVSNTNEGKIKTFEDWKRTSQKSQEAMKYCYNSNIIGGKSNTVLDPQGKTTRAEVSAIIQRYVSKITI